MEIRDGDIFRWHYKEKNPEKISYWCKSCIAVAQKGWLSDTYWTSGDRTSWKYEDAIERLDLDFVANFDELDKVEPYKQHYYDQKDIVNLTHANSHGEQIYVRKGSSRCRVAMAAYVQKQIEKKEGEIRSAESSIGWLKPKLNSIQNGDDLDKIYI